MSIAEKMNMTRPNMQTQNTCRSRQNGSFMANNLSPRMVNVNQLRAFTPFNRNLKINIPKEYKESLIKKTYERPISIE